MCTAAAGGFWVCACRCVCALRPSRLPQAAPPATEPHRHTHRLQDPHQRAQALLGEARDGGAGGGRRRQPRCHHRWPEPPRAGPSRGAVLGGCRHAGQLLLTQPAVLLAASSGPLSGPPWMLAGRKGAHSLQSPPASSPPALRRTNFWYWPWQWDPKPRRSPQTCSNLPPSGPAPPLLLSYQLAFRPPLAWTAPAASASGGASLDEGRGFECSSFLPCLPPLLPPAAAPS